MRSERLRFATRVNLAIFATLLFASVIAPAQGHAQTFKVLHTFHGGNGASPWTQLTRDPEGNFYGTTGSGGKPCKIYGQGCGTVFKLDKTGKQVWVHSFNGIDGFEPLAGLLRDAAGNLYGTTVGGGDLTCFSLGCGTVFKLDKNGQKETILYRFTGNTGDGDGWAPESLLVGDASGNLYGTTIWGGGILNIGVVFKVAQSGKETVLYTFQGGADGGSDYPGVIWGSPGNLYGIAGYGAYNNGVLFEVNAATGEETVLYTAPADQEVGSSVLVADEAGNFYGTASQGGNLSCGGGAGCGIVYELSPQVDGSWAETVLYTFCCQSNCADGERPLIGPLVRDTAGNLYGTTYFGGTYDDGVIFKLDTTGGQTVLHTFTGGADGANPVGGLTMDAAGNLYGTAEVGGDLGCVVGNGYGCGTVFEITP